MAKILTLTEKRWIAADKLFSSSSKRDGEYEFWNEDGDSMSCKEVSSWGDGCNYSDWHWGVEFKPNTDEIIGRFTA